MKNDQIFKTKMRIQAAAFEQKLKLPPTEDSERIKFHQWWGYTEGANWSRGVSYQDGYDAATQDILRWIRTDKELAKLCDTKDCTVHKIALRIQKRKLDESNNQKPKSI